MREYRGFWPEYWWVCLGSILIAAVGAWLTWTPFVKPAVSINAVASCKNLEHPAPGYCP
jgi:hypothetical protein